MRFQLQILSLLAACTAAAAERPAIGLLTEFPARATPTLRQEFRHETERALQSVDVDLVWRQLSELTISESFDRLVVIRFQGDCLTPPSTFRNRRDPLGLTHVTEGTVLPFVEINCHRVLEAMDAVRWPGGPRYELAVGRALARVAAHEIHHALTASGVHDREGLMRSSFTSRDLLCLELDFSRRSVTQLKSSLGTGSAQSSPPVRTDD